MMVKNWNTFPLRPSLAAGKCQLWQAWLDKEDPASFLGFLSNDERLRAGRLRSRLFADRFIVARGVLRTMLGRYMEYSPERIIFSYGLYGKPELAGGLKGRLSFNVSHSAGMAVFAIAKGFEVGVDVEEVHPVSDLESTASIFLSPEELAEFVAMPSDGKLERFYSLWTSKEALLKARGTGFANPIANILSPQNQHGLQSEGQIDISNHKRIIMLNPAQGFKGALACL